jgi:hypothetical protein
MADLKEKSISLLSTKTVSLAAAAATTLYTVPTGKRCVLHSACIVIGADAGTSTVTIGQVGALTDFLNTQTLSALDAANDSGWLMPVPNATTVKVESYAAGTVIQVNVTAANGGASNVVYLFGFLYDA